MTPVTDGPAPLGVGGGQILPRAQPRGEVTPRIKTATFSQKWYEAHPCRLNAPLFLGRRPTMASVLSERTAISATVRGEWLAWGVQ